MAGKAEIAKKLLGALFKSAPKPVAWKHAPTVNIGLNVNDGSKLSPEEAIEALQKFGVEVTHKAVKQSGTEPTLVARLSRSLTNDEAHKISEQLRQDAIAQIDHNGVGELHGPAADNWRPFNQDYFLGLDAEPTIPRRGSRKKAWEGAVRLYHGTEADKIKHFLKTYQGSQQGEVGTGHWFTSNPENAGFYGPNIASSDVRLKNPLVVTPEMREDRYRNIDLPVINGPTGWAKEALSKGHDGVIIKDTIDGSHPSDIYSVFDPRNIKVRGMFPAGEKDKYADGGKVYSDKQIMELNNLFDPDRDIRDYENMRDELETMPDDIRYSTHLGDKPRRPMHLETFGTKIPLGDAPYDVAEGAEDLIGLGYTGARIAPYFSPWTAPVAAAADIAEGLATDDPLTAGMGVAFGPGGKIAKAVGTGAIAAMAGSDDAEAGFIGTLAKGIDKEALQLARELDAEGVDPEKIRKMTKWFRGPDGKWRTERSTAHVKNKPWSSRADVPLSDIHDDEELFEMYPHLKNWRFNSMNEKGAHVDTHNKRMTVGDVSDPFYKPYGGRDGVIAHEMDHAIADYEGWASGTSLPTAERRLFSDADRFAQSADPSDRKMGRFLQSKIKNATKPNPIEDDDFLRDSYLLHDMRSEVYMRNPGEIMARNAARRNKFTNEEINRISPLETLDRSLNTVIDPQGQLTPVSAYEDMIKYLESLAARRKMDKK